MNNGAPFIATNLDDGMPSEHGILPGNGAICKVIIATTKKEPLNIGKPSHELIDLACQTINGLKQETLIVGDNLYTDILAAHRSGMDSLLVFSGYSQKHDLLCSEIKPTHQVDDLSQWLSMLS